MNFRLLRRITRLLSNFVFFSPILIPEVITSPFLILLQITIQLLLIIHQKVLPTDSPLLPLLKLFLLLLHEVINNIPVQIHLLDDMGLEVEVLPRQDVV
jgi:hypothetical protein